MSRPDIETQQIEIQQYEPPDPSDERLIALFDKLEAQQLDFLDQAGKRVIELSTGMLGLLFAVTAFGKDFPPPYLAGNLWATGLAIATLLLYLAALLMGVLAVQPRTYKRYEYDVTQMRAEFERMIGYKRRWFRRGTYLFFGGSLTLTALVITVLI